MSSGTILLAAATLLFTVNYDNMSIATSILLNENPKTAQFQNLSGHGPSIQLTAKKLPGCQTIGQYEEPHPNVRVAWSTFKEHMNNYTNYHHHQLQKLRSGDSSIHTLTWSCYNPVECCGIGDQLYIIQQALVYAIISDRVLSLHWNPASYETMKYLRPN